MTNVLVSSVANLAPVLINGAGAVGAPPLNASYTDQRYPLMSRQNGSNGSEFLYVYASASLAQYLAVGIDMTTGKAVAITAANTVGSGQRTQVAVTDQSALAAGTYGWVSLAGPVSVKVKKGTHLKKAMFVSTTAGFLTSTSTALASARALAAFSEVIGIGALPAASGINVLGTASASGDVRPFVIAAGGAFIDKNVLHGFNLTT